MKRIDLDSESADAMARMRISARGGGNYYGKGTYGGKRLKSYAEKISKNIENHSRASADYKIKLGEACEDTIKKTGANKHIKQEAAPHIDVDFLDEISVGIYNMMKPDVPMTADELVTKETSISDVLSSLTALEIAGAVEAGAGGYFLRRSSDDIELNAAET